MIRRATDDETASLALVVGTPAQRSARTPQGFASGVWHRCFSVTAAGQLSPGGTVEVKVGIQHVNREIVVESAESATDVEKELMSSIGVGGDGVFTRLRRARPQGADPCVEDRLRRSGRGERPARRLRRCLIWAVRSRNRAVDPPPSSSLAEERTPPLAPPPCGGARFPDAREPGADSKFTPGGRAWPCGGCGSRPAGRTSG